MAKLSAKKVGLTIGIFLAVLHLAWLILLLLGVGARFLEWILGLHMMEMPITFTAFSWTNAAILLIATFVSGLVFGWVFATLYNYLDKKVR